MKDIFRLIRLDNLLFLVILLGVMYHWVAVPILAHYLMPAPLTWWQLTLLIAAVVLIAAGGYVVNDYFDVKIDAINRPERLVVTRSVTKQQAMYLFYGLTAVGIACGLALAWTLHSTTLGTLFIFIPGVLWFYSASYKRQFLVGNMVIAFLAALTPLMVAFAVDASIRFQYGVESLVAQYLINAVYLWIGGFALFAFLLTWAREVLKDIEDQEGDRELECHTIPVKYGTRGGQIFVTCLIVLVMALIAYFVFHTFRPATLPVGYWTSFPVRFCGVMLVGFVCNLVLLWRARLTAEFARAQLVLKFLMFIGLFFAYYVEHLL